MLKSEHQYSRQYFSNGMTFPRNNFTAFTLETYLNSDHARNRETEKYKKKNFSALNIYNPYSVYVCMLVISSCNLL